MKEIVSLSKEIGDTKKNQVILELKSTTEIKIHWINLIAE